MTRGQRTGRAVRRAAKITEERYAARVETAWRLAILDVFKLAVRRLEAGPSALVASAEWVLPDPDELLPQDVVATSFRQRTTGLRSKMVVTMAGEVAVSFDEYAWTARNVYVERTIVRAGAKVTRVADDVRREVADMVTESWRAGDALVDLERNLTKLGPDFSRTRARMIARTELTMAQNGGGQAAIFELNGLAAEAGDDPVASYKTWIASMDTHVRDTHAAANGQSVPVAQAFVVGDDRLQYPGDPEGIAEEVINCRCTLGYE